MIPNIDTTAKSRSVLTPSEQHRSIKRTEPTSHKSPLERCRGDDDGEEECSTGVVQDSVEKAELKTAVADHP